MNDIEKQNPPSNGVGSTDCSAIDPPHTKDIEFCANRGCAFNANTGKCLSTFGQCYGYFPPNVKDQRRPAEGLQ